MEVTRDRVLEALKTVNDPELHQDLVSLGMVATADVDGRKVKLVINLTTPACPMRARIERDVREAVATAVGDVDLEIEFGSTMRGPDKQPLPGVSTVVAVGSGKGGVGKSTVAANLAASLVLEGATVGILDADIYGPSQGKMFGVEGKRLMADDEKRMLPLRNHGVKVISIANLVEDGQALTWRGPILHGTLTQLLNQTTWGELDYLVIDLPPGTGDVQLSLAQLITITGMVLVTTPQDMALVDVRRAYTMARKTHIPVLGVIENMSYYALPDGSRDYIFGEGGAVRWAEQEKLPMLGSIPITRSRAARLMAGQISVASMATLPMI